MKKILIFIIPIPLLLCSCSKKIDGRIMDNFGKPLEGVEVLIKDQNSRAISNSKGEFVVGYVADEFTLLFKKSNYMPLVKPVKISELSSHSLGDLRTIKLPDSTGVYFQEEDGYIRIPETLLKIRFEEMIENGKAVSSQTFLNVTPGMVFPIEKDSANSETILVFGGGPYALVEPSPDGTVATIISDISCFQETKETVSHPGDNIEEHRFPLQFDKTYTLVSVDESHNSKDIKNNRAFAFKCLRKH